MHGNHVTLEQFKQELTRREAVKHDLVAPASKLLMLSDTLLGVEGNGTYEINPYCHGQIAEKVKCPKKYYDEVSRVPGLRSLIVNETLRHEGARHLVRTLDGKARAFLSDRYRPIDNLQTLDQSILPALVQYKDSLEIRTHQLNDNSMFFQVMFPLMVAEVKVGDPVYYGLTFRNSEVGDGSLNIQESLFWLKCLNWAIGESLIRKYHVGKRINTEDESVYGLYKDDTIAAELRSFQLRTRDIVANALTGENFKKRIASLRDTTQVQLPEPDQVVVNVTERYSLREEERRVLNLEFIKSGDYTGYGLLNAITALSHKTDDLNRQYDLERLGNELITYGAAQWDSLRKKAA